MRGTGIKHKLSYLVWCAVVSCATLTACIDDNFVDPDAPGNNLVKVSLRLVLPSGETVQTRAGGTGTKYGELDENTTYQKYISDIWILVFSENESGKMVFDGLVENLKPDNNQGDPTRTVEGTYRRISDKVNIAVLTNLTYNLPNAPQFDTWKGLTEQEIYEKLVYDYPKEGLVLDEKRFLPMWGKAENVPLDKERNEASLSLYRAVAKMGVQVDAQQCKTFTLEKVYVYYDNNSGYCAAPHVNPNQTEDKQYEAPDVPASASSFGIDTPQIYTVTGNITMEQIYLSEVKNKENNGNRMKVVVGGHYTGEGLVESDALSYYRIDMEDTYDESHSTNVGTMTPFDIIRNHSYIFNITGVDNPGTPTPDKALDSDVAKIKVRIEQYADEPMRGVPDQYTLTTDESVITFNSFDDLTEQAIEVWTDYELGWSIELIDGENTDWLTMENTTGNKDQKVLLKIKPGSKNRSLTRSAHFMVTAGNIKKQITVIQPQPPTANSYVVGNGDHELIVGIKGNGVEGTMPEGANILENGEDATLKPKYIGIIWETAPGLVRLKKQDGTIVDNKKIGGHPNECDYDPKTMTVKYVVNESAGSIGGVTGGNTLVGAFDENHRVIWSWHIWVCPEMVGSDGNIKEECVENWPLTDYIMMDRNLGALANRPITSNSNNQMSVASMGLLYQWGRKDPFIGSNYSNEKAFVDNWWDNGLIKVYHYYEDWSVFNTGDQYSDTKQGLIGYTIQHPTHMVYQKVSGYDQLVYKTSNGGTATKNLSRHKGMSELTVNGGYLWGTDRGYVEEATDVGSKTIYDPCPAGYRVPPIDAFVFRGDALNPAGININSTEEPNWTGGWQQCDRVATTYNNVYVQFSTNNGATAIEEQFYRSFTPNRTPKPSNDYKYFRVMGINSNQYQANTLDNCWESNLMFVPHNLHMTNAINNKRKWVGGDFTKDYRFNLQYVGDRFGRNNAVGTGLFYGAYINRDKIVEPPHASLENNALKGYEIQNPEKYSWFPISGVLDPASEFNMRTFVDEWPSLSVNSFLWTNSSCDVAVERNNKGDVTRSRWIPAAMFLHGGEGWDRPKTSGRHIHAMNYGDIRADSHFAGSVRCVRDRKKLTWSQNDLPSQSTIRYGKGSETTFSIVSVGGGWKLVEPGAPWIKVTPDRGGKTPLAGEPITIRIIGDVNAYQTTTLSFQIDGEAEPRKIIIRTTW